MRWRWMPTALAVTLSGVVGGTTKLASLTIDGGQIDIDTVKTTGNIDIEGTNIDLNAATYESDDGDITFTGPVDLTVNTTVDSDKDDDSDRRGHHLHLDGERRQDADAGCRRRRRGPAGCGRWHDQADQPDG